ncbi:MAG: hypothetical protein RLZ69_1295, partial [Actinomycetota bacterium]
MAFRAGSGLSRSSFRVLVATASVVGLLFSPLTAAPANAVPNYPSWADVQNAKKKVAA